MTLPEAIKKLIFLRIYAEDIYETITKAVLPQKAFNLTRAFARAIGIVEYVIEKKKEGSPRVLHHKLVRLVEREIRQFRKRAIRYLVADESTPDVSLPSFVKKITLIANNLDFYAQNL